MDLSILIPARNEMFLKNTIDNILENIEGDTEVIAALDGYWPEPVIEDHPRVKLIHFSESVGQRAATNAAAKISNAKYLMKTDAHVAFDKGFDVKMMKDMKPNWTMVPVMRNLHAFDWVCKNGHRRYQGPSGPCKECKEDTVMEIKWFPKPNPQSTAYRFDKEMHFQYWNDWGRKQEGSLTESMSIQGSCFMLTRDKYFELDICSEDHFSSWGQQGVEVACKTWLSGGRVVITRKTWYAHMFRTQGGDFSFPYKITYAEQQDNRDRSRELFAKNNWPLAKHKFQWLINKFKPPEWKTKGILYYTDNEVPEKIGQKVRKQLLKADLPITSVSLKPMPKFGRNIHMALERGLYAMTKQIVAGLEAMEEDVVFMCEHDVLYPPEHFDFTPEKEDVYYYNTNSWWLRSEDGHCLYFDHRAQSQLCGFKTTLLKHYKERLRRIEALIEEAGDTGIVKAASGNDIPLKEGIHRLGFEPGTHNRPEKIDELGYEDYRTEIPTIDVRHNNNWTQNRWSIKQFRSKPKEWIESDEIPGWGKGKEII